MSLLPLFRKDIKAKSILASVDTDSGKVIETFQLRYPRIIHSEFMTHRVLSKNAASSRAIPVASILLRDADMFVPDFRLNKPGMQPGEHLSPEAQAEAAAIWQDAANYCIEAAKKLSDKEGLNVAKQWANRMLEFFGYIDVLVTGTEWKNFFALRDHGAAQDEIRLLARAIKEARRTPVELDKGEWHLPYITDADRLEARSRWVDFQPAIHEAFSVWEEELPELSMSEALLLIASAARCCRLSYSKLDGTPSTFEYDIRRFKQLVPTNDPVHASPLEHQATPMTADIKSERQANFRGWAQFRQFVPGHTVPG